MIFDPEDGGDISSEVFINIWTTWRYIPEDGNILATTMLCVKPQFKLI
jgi:hypothetical protein